MRGTRRLACGLLLVCTLFTNMGLGAPALASTPRDDGGFSGYAEIDGPVRLEISASPPIARPGDSITVALSLTNRLSRAVAPAVDLTLPSVFASSLPRLPAGTAFNTQHNTLGWQPVVGENGGIEKLTLTFTVSVADISRPEQTINVELGYDGELYKTSMSFWIGSPPSATIEINPQVVAVGQTVKLQALAAGPGPFTESWDLGDGRQITARDPEVAFALPGIYEVRLRVSNPLASATAISEVTVVSQPTADFSLDDELPVVGQMVQFINQSGGERPLTSLWEFGDGTESQDANPSHNYTAPGTYIVRLVVTSPYGQAETSVPVSVGANPVADMVLAEQAATGEAIQAMGFGDDSVHSLRWDMGDGTQLEGGAVTHT
ncbi:MAG TPA: PKD domain-containing protein, partial [Candidatus Binatia bacterium]|nr:PKD domain-containing protein [Candidatus Binatia bacterium]